MSGPVLVASAFDPGTLTILVVEDEVLIRMGIAEYLRDRGYKVTEAGQASEAVQIIEDADAKVDLVFSDVMMPGPMDGVGLAKWVHANRPGMPVLLTSGVTLVADTIDEIFKGGAFIAKPYDIEFVASRIRALTRPVAPAN